MTDSATAPQLGTHVYTSSFHYILPQKIEFPHATTTMSVGVCKLFNAAVVNAAFLLLVVIARPSVVSEYIV